jgi:hypothetical protein
VIDVGNAYVYQQQRTVVLMMMLFDLDRELIADEQKLVAIRAMHVSRDRNHLYDQPI